MKQRKKKRQVYEERQIDSSKKQDSDKINDEMPMIISALDNCVQNNTEEKLFSNVLSGYISEEDLKTSDMFQDYANESKKEKKMFSAALFNYDSEEDLKTSDMFQDYANESKKEEKGFSAALSDYVPEEDLRLQSDISLSSYEPKAKKVIVRSEDYAIETVKAKREKDTNIAKQRNDVNSISFKGNKSKKENTSMRDLAYKLKKLLYFKVIHRELYGYEDGIYNLIKKEEDLGKFLMRLLPEFCQEMISKYTNFKEIFQWLKVIPELQVENFEEKMERNVTCIPFQNGLYDIVTGKLLEYSEERLVFYKLKATYLGKECDLPPIWNNFLFCMSPVDEEVSTIICQMILNCLLIGNKSKTFALMLPSPNSGKSVLGNALIGIIGREHITTRSFFELSKRFGLANLEGMALNVCMEADTSLSKAAIRSIKGLTGESYINSEAKGVNHEVIYNNIKLIFGVNDIPILEEMDEAFFNRLQCIPMMYSIPIEQQDKFLLQKLIEEADQFLSWLVNNEVTEQFVNNNFSYSYCEKAEELKQKIQESCKTCNNFLNEKDDMIQAFIDLCIEETEDKKDFVSNQILYLAYEAFCKERNVLPLCQPKAFSRKFAKFGIGIKSKAYDQRIQSKSLLNGFKGIKLIDEIVNFE